MSDQKGDGGHSHHAHDFSEMRNILQQDYQLKAERMMEFLDKVGLSEGSHVLEIGCGFSFLLPHYLRHVGASGSVTLSDQEPKFGEKLAPLLGDAGRFVACGGEEVADKCRCVASSAGYDLVVLGNVFHHLDDVGRTLSAIRSVLRPGGHVVVFDFLHDTSRLYTRAPTRVPQLLRPEMDSVSARCPELLEASGLSPRRADSYVLRGRPGSDLWRLYMSTHIPFALERRVEDGSLRRDELEDIVANELPAVANDAGAVLFSDVVIQVAAARE